MFQRAMQAVRAGEYASPKTILGFLASIAAICAAVVVGLAFALAGTSSLHYLIVGFAGFLLVLICVVVGIVVTFAWKDPSKLQLGQVSAKDYIAIQTMGDDTYGEFIELPSTVAPRSSDQSTSETAQIEASDQEPAE
jgi:hypothetical protein